jgi:hypothetical protein
MAVWPILNEISKSKMEILDYWLMLAESRLTRRLFGSMVRRIAALPVPAG